MAEPIKVRIEAMKVNYFKLPEDPEGIRISLGRTKDRSLGYVIYRGDLEELKEVMYILNEFVQKQSKEAPPMPKQEG